MAVRFQPLPFDTGGISVDRVEKSTSAGRFIWAVARLLDAALRSTRVEIPFGTAALRYIGTVWGAVVEVDSTGKIPAALIKNIDASQIVGGELTADQIPEFHANRITGVFDRLRFGDIPPRKVRFGKLDRDRLPSGYSVLSAPTEAKTTPPSGIEQTGQYRRGHVIDRQVGTEASERAEMHGSVSGDTLYLHVYHRIRTPPPEPREPEGGM